MVADTFQEYMADILMSSVDDVSITIQQPRNQALGLISARTNKGSLVLSGSSLSILAHQPINLEALNQTRIQEVIQPLFAFTTIKRLNLQGPGISSLPPEFFSLMANLRFLSIHKTSLTTLPSSFSRCKELWRLSLGYTPLSLSEIPLESFSRLSSLELQSVSTSSFPPSDFQISIPTLKEVHLSHNSLKELNSSITCFPSLERLTINSNNLTSLPDEIAHLRSLHTIDLFRNKFTTIPHVLEQLEKLKEINLTENNIDEIPSWLTTHPRSLYVHLKDNYIQQFSVVNFIDGENRLALDLRGNPLDKKTLAKFKSITRLANSADRIRLRYDS